MVTPFVHRAFRSIGLDVIRYPPYSFDNARFLDMLSRHHVNLIFDVGANSGQFGRHLRQIGYKGRIVSFEPLSEAWGELEKASADDPFWELAPRGAVGSEDGEIEIHIAGNSQSSSILPMLDSHLDAAPQSKYMGIERVSLRRLDSIGSGYLEPDSVPFIKIDTQGFEGPVLQGARDLLGIVVGLQLELSLVPLYGGQLLFDSLIRDLQEKGFAMWEWTCGLRDPQSGRLLQADATFFRN